MYEHLLDGLNPAQRRAVESEAAPLCILAGAGSGKTRVVTRRIAYRVLTGAAEPGHVLAVTFTRKAAGELRSRLSALGVRDHVAAGTFHALAYAQLRRRWADRGERAPTILERKTRLLAPLLSRRSSSSGRPSAVTAFDLASEIEWAKARMIPPSQYEHEASAARRTPPFPAAAMAAIYQHYEDDKRRKGLVDFDDLLMMCAAALEDDPEFAAAQRWRFRHLFVDEFQDVNPVQHRLLAGWLGDRRDLCVVGDPNQAIYSWNGADPTFLTDFDRHFPGGETVELERNYRSTPQVLAVARAILQSARLEPTRPDGAVPVIRAFDNDVAEARGIARAARRAHGSDTPWSHMAVLVRTNAQTVLFEEAFRAAGVPCRVRGGPFLSLPDVRDALASLKSGSAGVPFRSKLADLEAFAAEPDLPAERRLHIEALVRMGVEYLAADEQATVAGFLAWLQATVRGDDGPQSSDAVEISTFHRAKGLEWPVVFVCGLERGLVPIGHASSPAAEAEERRLLYVALTRAERDLTCSWAERRTFGSKSVARQPSPWLDAIEITCTALASGAPPNSDEWRKRIAEQRDRLKPKRPIKGGVEIAADDPMFEALKVWRSQTARAANVPAYVIFHDSTLAAVASAKPTTKDELLALPGLGPVKAARYGDALLGVVAGRSAVS